MKKGRRLPAGPSNYRWFSYRSLPAEHNAGRNAGIVLGVGEEAGHEVFGLNHANTDVRRRVPVDSTAERHGEGIRRAGYAAAFALAMDSGGVALFKEGTGTVRAAEQGLHVRGDRSMAQSNLGSEQVRNHRCIRTVLAPVIPAKIRHHAQHRREVVSQRAA